MKRILLILAIALSTASYSQLTNANFQVIKESITNSLDISQLEKGVYIIQLSDGAKLTTQKILKN